MIIRSAKELEVYRKSYELVMMIFHLSKRFPSEERFALTSQIRRSSRSVSTNLREVWAKRRYLPHFVSKLTDCDGENSETDTALDYAKDCGYITPDEHKELSIRCAEAEIGRMLGSMIRNPTPFCEPVSKSKPDSSAPPSHSRPLTSDL
jgi:four helix bundle protein